ncbi:MAG: ribose-phosphate pyrophosphokinase [Oscillospiraceae bacterium]|jgi:ribose-phosphate pyrophosphokinase|nr:ribose-phosphate pyrophosphokinase [Oscillospiraceae bacterium]
MRQTELVMFAGNSNLPLANAICRELGKTLGRADVARFSDGECNISIYETVRGTDVFLVQSTCNPVNENMMELLIMIDACKRASAARITAVIPYFGYARQDRKAKSRDPISAKLVANLITTAGADRVLTMDLHADQIQGFFDIPLDHLLGMGQFVDSCKKLMKNNPGEYIVVSADIGNVKRSRMFADRLGLDLAIVEKRRNFSVSDSSEALNVIGRVNGKHVLMLDEVVSTAGTLVHAAAAVQAFGAEQVYAFATHGVLAGAALDILNASAIEKLTLLDTIPYPADKPACPKIEYISSSHLFAEAIRRIHDEVSLASLF